MDILLRPNEAARRLGLSVRMLQLMDRQGRLRVVRTPGGRRRIPESEVHRLMGEKEVREPILYARVSSHDQKKDLERQKERLLQAHPGAEMFYDIRSGLKFDRKGFRSVLKAVQERRVSKVVVLYEDRLARFGFDLLEQVFAAYGTSIEVLETTEKSSPEIELSKDLVSIITSFSARLYGMRSHKTRKLLSVVKEVVRSEPSQ